jgi:hypothetical protein
MADVTISILITNVQYTAWLRTSLIGLNQKAQSGLPLISETELGPDQMDAITNFLDEATREVSRLFISRQGDVTGVPFEVNSTNAIYRFNEATPVLPQASAIKSIMAEDVKNAIFSYITFLWFSLKGDQTNMSLFLGKYNSLSIDIQNNLYRLHD